MKKIIIALSFLYALFPLHLFAAYLVYDWSDRPDSPQAILYQALIDYGAQYHRTHELSAVLKFPKNKVILSQDTDVLIIRTRLVDIDGTMVLFYRAVMTFNSWKDCVDETPLWIKGRDSFGGVLYDALMKFRENPKNQGVEAVGLHDSGTIFIRDVRGKLVIAQDELSETETQFSVEFGSDYVPAKPEKDRNSTSGDEPLMKLAKDMDHRLENVADTRVQQCFENADLDQMSARFASSFMGFDSLFREGNIDVSTEDLVRIAVGDEGWQKSLSESMLRDKAFLDHLATFRNVHVSLSEVLPHLTRHVRERLVRSCPK